MSICPACHKDIGHGNLNNHLALECESEHRHDVQKQMLPAQGSHPGQIPNEYQYAPTREFGVMMLLAFFFPIHFFFLKKVGIGIAFWVISILLALTIIGLVVPLIWWFVNLFLVKGWTNEYNNRVLAARGQPG